MTKNCLSLTYNILIEGACDLSLPPELLFRRDRGRRWRRKKALCLSLGKFHRGIHLATREREGEIDPSRFWIASFMAQEIKCEVAKLRSETCWEGKEKTSVVSLLPDPFQHSFFSVPYLESAQGPTFSNLAFTLTLKLELTQRDAMNPLIIREVHFLSWTKNAAWKWHDFLSSSALSLSLSQLKHFVGQSRWSRKVHTLLDACFLLASTYFQPESVGTETRKITHSYIHLFDWDQIKLGPPLLLLAPLPKQ